MFIRLCQSVSRQVALSVKAPFTIRGTTALRAEKKWFAYVQTGKSGKSGKRSINAMTQWSFGLDWVCSANFGQADGKISLRVAHKSLVSWSCLHPALQAKLKAVQLRHMASVWCLAFQSHWKVLKQNSIHPGWSTLNASNQLNLHKVKETRGTTWNIMKQRVKDLTNICTLWGVAPLCACK